jgi:hypothetical protein
VRVLTHDRLKKRAQKRAESAKPVNKTVFAVDDLVLVKSHRLSSADNKQISKFFKIYEGPYRVVKVVGPNAYLLATVDSNQITSTQNVNNLKPYVSSV